MQFQVCKAGIDGISSVDKLTLEQATNEVFFHKGWDSLKQLRTAIKKWGKTAKPGSVFRSPSSVVVCTTSDSIEDSVCPECGEEDCVNLEFGDLEPVEDGQIEQEMTCNSCGYNWMDIFQLVDRKELSRKGK